MRPQVTEFRWIGLLALPLAVCSWTAFAQEAAGERSAQERSAYQAEMERQWKLHPTLGIGVSAPEFDLPGTDGKQHTLSEFKGSVLAVVFICNHCPASQLYEDRIKKLVAEYGRKVKILDLYEI